MKPTFINDADYKVTLYAKNNKQIWTCPIYKKWYGLKARTTEMYIQSRPTYNDVVVCEEWYLYSNFVNWIKTLPFDMKYLGELHLDKDLKNTLGKIYSPDTCSLIPYYINDAIRISYGSRGTYPLGVSKEIVPENSKRRKIYKASVRMFGKLKNLGRYETVNECHRAWQLGKIQYFNDIIEKYKAEPFYYSDVECSLITMRDKIQNEYDNNLETTYL